jgi:CO/xanthine dehydrogenase FAD-binding subunit
MPRWTLPNFTYLETESIGETLYAMKENPRTFLKAGGTDLLVRMRRGELSPGLVINIQRMKGLGGITVGPTGELLVGPMTTMGQLFTRSLVSPWHALADAARSMGTPQIRSLATVGGNVCNGSPVADVATALMAYGAMASLETLSGEELIPVEELLKTHKGNSFILKQIRLSPLQGETVGAFLKFTRAPGSELPIVSCAAVLTFEEGTLRCIRSRIVLGGVGPHPVRLERCEEALVSDRITDDIVENACDVVQEEIHPISDLRASAEYRLHLAKVLLKRSCDLALHRRKLPSQLQTGHG